MDDLWTEELTPEEEKALIEKVTKEITKRGLEVPATFFLEMHKPVSRIAGQGMIAFGPFLAPFIGMGNLHDYSRFAMKDGSIERLLKNLEDRSNEDVSSEDEN